MQAQRPVSFWAFLLFFFLLAFFVGGKLHAQETPRPSDSLQSLWDSLKTELTESELDWMRLSNLLATLQTETKELKFLLQESTEQSNKLMQALDMQKKLTKNWQTGAIIGTGAALVAGIIVGGVIKK